MCRTSHIDFHHNCGHTQKIDRPSTNPNCNVAQQAVCYRFKGDSHRSTGWCKRCYRSALFADPAYAVEAPGLECQYLKPRPQTVPQTLVTVILGPVPFVNYDVPTLWDRRFTYMAMRNEVGNRALWRRWHKQMDAEDDAHLHPLDRTYFFPFASLQNPPDPGFYTILNTRDANRDPTEPDRCVCGLAVPWNDLPADVQPCAGGPVAMMPCAHVFGLRCIRQQVEEHHITTCPTCDTQWKIKYEPLALPYVGWATALNEHLERRENGTGLTPFEWFWGCEGWYARVVMHILLAVCWHALFGSSKWPPWWTLGVGTLVYTFTTTLPIKRIAEVEVFAFHWARSLVWFVWRIGDGSAAVDWGCVVVLVLAGWFLWFRLLLR